ncbi:MAG: 5-formyltetrahydrofolate cyclo-ligase [Candidatus Amulumruptor caecigallinarius]|nr:5-formyltetrahydrofolate cyclo-ligase [Candidatus Amulumruptor caecigallinarius]
MEKNEIRRKIKAMRSMLLDMEKEDAARQVFDRLEQTAAFLMSNHILMYHSLPDELSTRSFLKKWKDRKKFYLPRVNGVNLEILPYDESRIELGSFHIEEPVGNDTIDPDILDLIIVPGVAFDHKGNRLGRGKGFYDRLLSNTRATKIGVGYEFQIVEEIPTETHDVPMDAIVSQTECFYITLPTTKKNDMRK